MVTDEFSSVSQLPSLFVCSEMKCSGRHRRLSSEDISLLRGLGKLSLLVDSLFPSRCVCQGMVPEFPPSYVLGDSLEMNVLLEVDPDPS